MSIVGDLDTSSISNEEASLYTKDNEYFVYVHQILTTEKDPLSLGKLECSETEDVDALGLFGLEEEKEAQEEKAEEALDLPNEELIETDCIVPPAQDILEEGVEHETTDEKENQAVERTSQDRHTCNEDSQVERNIFLNDEKDVNVDIVHEGKENKDNAQDDTRFPPKDYQNEVNTKRTIVGDDKDLRQEPNGEDHEVEQEENTDGHNDKDSMDGEKRDQEESRYCRNLKNEQIVEAIEEKRAVAGEDSGASDMHQGPELSHDNGNDKENLPTMHKEEGNGEPKHEDTTNSQSQKDDSVEAEVEVTVDGKGREDADREPPSIHQNDHGDYHQKACTTGTQHGMKEEDVERESKHIIDPFDEVSELSFTDLKEFWKGHEQRGEPNVMLVHEPPVKEQSFHPCGPSSHLPLNTHGTLPCSELPPPLSGTTCQTDCLHGKESVRGWNVPS